MGKLKYDKEKLDFLEERPSFWKILGKVVWFIVATAGLGLLYYVIFAIFFNTEEEKRMITETRIIEKEYDGLNDKVERLESVVADLKMRDKDIYQSIFNANPPEFSSNILDSTSNYNRDTTFEHNFVEATHLKLYLLENEVSLCSKLFLAITDTLSNQKERFLFIPSIIPVMNFSIVQTGASVGMKMHPFYKKVVMHNGLDLVTPIGTQVRASASGTVIQTSRSQKNEGNRVVIDHGNGYVTSYSHLSDIMVVNNQKVKQGAIIGRVGTSGTTFAPHLHYEVELNNKYVDPINYFFADLSPNQYNEIRIIAVNTGQSLD